MSANILKFPVPQGGDKKQTPLRPPPVHETFDRERTAELMASARNTISSAETLLELIHSRRELARQSGVETIAIEILAIMEGHAFTGVTDAIEEAAQQGQPVSLTRMGLQTLRRIEALVAEASTNIRKFSDEELGVPDDRVRLEADSPKTHLVGRQIGSSTTRMGQLSSTDLVIWIPLVLLGAALVAAVVAVIVAGKNNTSNYP